MTAVDRFDPFEQRITDALDEIAAPRRPEYLGDVFRVTETISQRARWTFPGRWLPLAGAMPGAPAWTAGQRPLVLLLVLALAALASAALLVAGTQRAPAIPTATNGLLVYSRDGALYVRDGVAGDERLLLALPGPGHALVRPHISPDGRRIALVNSSRGGDLLLGSVLDDRGRIRAPGVGLLLEPPVEAPWSGSEPSTIAWSPDSRSLLVTGSFGGVRRLFLVPADAAGGTGATEIELDGLIPWDATWSPTDADLFLLRAQRVSGVGSSRLLLARPDGTIVRELGLSGQPAQPGDIALAGVAWSPDGTRIAYNTSVTQPGTLFRTDRVRIDDVRGGPGVVLVTPPGDGINEGWPLWSPDGRSLLVRRWRWESARGAGDGAAWFAIAPADGRTQAVDIGPGADGLRNVAARGAWSPDGSLVLLELTEAGAVYAVDVASGAATRIEGADALPAWQPVVE
ncbi:MAG TPA: hypothetical protein VFY23_01620 [Candidatus Limnocylindrales bacterium]|nr:hypothetical protein [Candidatus Limnocylindrales bacterium]